MSSSGILLLDKPQGWTSHDAVARTRRLAGTRKVGHAGTLDPMATGLLVLGVESSTRLLTYVVGLDKEYLATIRLGANDMSGTITLSVGVTEWMVEDEPSDIVQRADTAMYQAKRAGKNRVAPSPAREPAAKARRQTERRRRPGTS